MRAHLMAARHGLERGSARVGRCQDVPLCDTLGPRVRARAKPTSWSGGQLLGPDAAAHTCAYGVSFASPSAISGCLASGADDKSTSPPSRREGIVAVACVGQHVTHCSHVMGVSRKVTVAQSAAIGCPTR